MKREDAYDQQIVQVKGYGGYATILSIEELPYLSMWGTPLYRATIKWGPNNSNSSTSLHSIGRTKYSPVEEFPLGRLSPASPTTTSSQQEPIESVNLDDLSEQELIELINKLKTQLQPQN